MVNDGKTIAYVNQAIMLGWPRLQVDAWANQQDPPIGADEIDRAYAACVERWIVSAATSDEQLYALHKARREDLYRRAMANGDLNLAHKVLVDLGKLEQQYRSEQRAAQERDTADDLIKRIKAKQSRAPSLRSVGGRG